MSHPFVANLSAAPEMLTALRYALDALEQYADVRDGDERPAANAAMHAAGYVRAAIESATQGEPA